MARLIDADAFKNWLMDNYICYDHTLEDIDKQPTIEAEPVVRCKDCILDREAECPMRYATEPDDYCSFGERMEDEK